MTEEVAITRNLFVKEGSSDKVFNVSLCAKEEGWVVSVVRGRRGTTLITDTKTPGGPVDYKSALAIFSKTVSGKIKGGYQESPDNEASPVYTAPEKREQTGLVAMQLNNVDPEDIEGLIANPDWCCEEKMNGRRMIIWVQASVLNATNRYGEISGIPTLVEQNILALNRDIILDGECVGEQFHAFDLISFDDNSLRVKPYSERKEVLDSILEYARGNNIASNWQTVDTFTSEQGKRELIARVRAAGGEGVVFKLNSGKYSPGKPASGGSQLKFKFVKMLSAIVTRINKKKSIGISLLDENGKLVEVGNATVYPNQTIPKLNDIVEIRYLYGHRDGSLAQPKLLGLGDEVIRTDVRREDCKLTQVEYKDEALIDEPEEEEENSFKM